MKTSVISASDKVMSIGNATFLMEEKARFQLQGSQYPAQVEESCFEGSTRNGNQSSSNKDRSEGAEGWGVGGQYQTQVGLIPKPMRFSSLVIFRMLFSNLADFKGHLTI